MLRGMRINLTEIPEEGREWSVHNRSGELTQVLQDLIGSTGQYQADFSIRPLQAGTFELRGSVKTSMPELCSRCGEDFRWPVDEKFRELLLPALDQPRNSSFSKANHVSDLNDDGLSVSEYHGNIFEMGEFLHEIVALSMPPVPAPPKDANGRCSQCKIPVQEQRFTYDEQMEETTNPFGVLKDWKKN